MEVKRFWEIKSSGGYNPNYNHLVPRVEDPDFRERMEYLREFSLYRESLNVGQPRAKNTEKFIIEGKLVHGAKYGYDNAIYINSTTEVILYCYNCQKYFYQIAGNHREYGCFACARKDLGARKATKKSEFIRRAKKLHRFNNYDNIIFESCNRKVKNIFCTLCNKYFDSLGEAHINPSKAIGCPYCRRSKAEICAENYLSDNGYKFTAQYTDSTLKLTNVLKIDFMIYKNDKMFAVELNGKQHYKQANRSKDMELNRRNFELYQLRDRAKVAWCAERNIPLLVVSYLDFKKIPELIEAFIAENI
jgi:uncharacterized pyridoxamine 5'-phosphate oxidase family protein